MTALLWSIPFGLLGLAVAVVPLIVAIVGEPRRGEPQPRPSAPRAAAATSVAPAKARSAPAARELVEAGR